MAAKKKGFVLYFDSFEVLEAIEPSQRGELLSALYRYALTVCQQDANPMEFVQTCNALDADTRVAFCFMAGNIRRDTVKWLARQEHCRAAAMQNLAQGTEKRAISSRAEGMKKYIPN